MAGLQINLIFNISVVFVAALLGVVSFLSLLRRLRQRRRETLADIFAAFSDETRPMTAIEESQQFVPIQAEPKPAKLLPPLPNTALLKNQASSTDHLLLSIEPLDGPTRDQRNVQKLINFLKQETADAEPIQKVG
jgi:hypothetical protein